MDKIYVVSEDNHGFVSFWGDEEKAKEEVLKIVKSMYLDNEPENIKKMNDNELIKEFNDVVMVEEIELNKSWLD